MGVGNYVFLYTIDNSGGQRIPADCTDCLDVVTVNIIVEENCCCLYSVSEFADSLDGLDAPVTNVVVAGVDLSGEAGFSFPYNFREDNDFVSDVQTWLNTNYPGCCHKITAYYSEIDKKVFVTAYSQISFDTIETDDQGTPQSEDFTVDCEYVPACDGDYFQADYWMDIASTLVCGDVVPTLASFKVDGVEQLDAIIELCPLNIVDIGGDDYVTNAVDALNSVGVPDFEFFYSDQADPALGKLKYATIRWPYCQTFEIIITYDTTGQADTRWTEEGTYYRISPSATWILVTGNVAQFSSSTITARQNFDEGSSC